jgi:hypothetical protein
MYSHAGFAGFIKIHCSNEFDRTSANLAQAFGGRIDGREFSAFGCHVMDRFAAPQFDGCAQQSTPKAEFFPYAIPDIFLIQARPDWIQIRQ